MSEHYFGFARGTVRFKLAILKALAKYPGRRATLDEVRREVRVIIASGDQTEQLKRFPALGDIDIFQSGLVLQDDAGLQITDEGLLLLHSLESSSGPPLEVSSTPASQPFRLIDDLIGTEERLKIFDLELRTLEGGADGSDPQSEQEQENRSAPVGTPSNAFEGTAADLAERASPQISDEIDDHDRPSQGGDSRTTSIGSLDLEPANAPAFLRRSFGSKFEEPSQKSPQLSNIFAFIATEKRSILDLWRRHFAQDVAIPRTERRVGRVGGAAFAFLSLAMVVTCVGAAIALGQIRSLKSEIAMLHRELLPLRERLGKLEQV